MSPDIRDVLHDAARRPADRPDVDAIHARGRRRRVTARVVGGVGALLVVVLAVVGVNALTTGAGAPVVGPGSESPMTEAPPDGPPEPTDLPIVTPSDLDADVLLAVDGVGEADGHVLVHRPDGEPYRIPIETPLASRAAIVPDDRGGFSWQPAGGADGSPPILHVDREGRVREIVPSGSRASGSSTLIGGRGDTLLLEQRTGPTPETATADLVQVQVDDDPTPVTLAGDVGGAGTAVVSAAVVEPLVYATRSDDSSLVVVAPPRGERSTVFEGGGATGAHAVSLQANGNGQSVVLLDGVGDDGRRTARLLVVDAWDATVTAEVDVPLDPGGEGRAISLSLHTDQVLVNRRADGEWLRPLVYDIGDATWSVLDVTGRALLGRRSWDEEIEEPACTEDGDIRGVPPTDGSTLDLYLVCSSSRFWESVYRFPTDIEASGDVASDARAILDRLFEGVTEGQRQRGYYGLSRDTGNGSIGIRDVRFRDGTLVVDFDFPETGVGNYSTSSGMAVWHQLIVTNLLQFEEVADLELRAEGTCSYGGYFEGIGCARYERADAPWNRGDD